ncbi:MAG: hypothetical protein OEY24_02220 [Candidatus Bathyarchaeota archaeon]|nr:hypothetical protein [Candidatus Bathyarchaeota archaeon]MDH5494505.1 hypothetical protein [Candidatus Bathyarchaeota archaeon]
MKRVFSKSAKMLVLTLMGILVISATAAVYYSLDMTSTITTAANDIWFVEGLDNVTAGVTLFNDNKSATLTDLKAYPNITMTYDDPIKVRNNNTGTNHFVRLTPVSLTGTATYFVYINFTLQTSTPISLNYTSNGASWTTPSQTSFVQVDMNTEYSIVVETMANATAPADQIATIEIAVEVQL